MRTISLLVALAVVSSVGRGQSAVWQFAATACTPYADAINADRLTNANGNVRFNGGNTGIINLTCNVDLRVTSVRNLYLTWFEPTGQASREYEVRAELKGVSKAQGTIINVSSVSSDGFPASTANVTRESVMVPPAQQALDHRQNYYYVVITLRRTGIAHDIKAFGVSIRGSSN